MAKNWGPSNPLWRWQHRKANKSGRRHRSAVRHMAKRKSARSPRRYFRRFRARRDKRIPLLTAIGAVSGVILPPATSGGGVAPYKAIMDGQYQWAIEGILENYTGYNLYTNSWNLMNARGLMLIIVGAVGSRVASAVGANKALRRIPFVGSYIKL